MRICLQSNYEVLEEVTKIEAWGIAHSEGVGLRMETTDSLKINHLKGADYAGIWEIACEID